MLEKWPSLSLPALPTVTKNRKKAKNSCYEVHLFRLFVARVVNSESEGEGWCTVKITKIHQLFVTGRSKSVLSLWFLPV